MPETVFQPFIVEVGVEEIPSRYVERLAENFAQMMEAALNQERLAFQRPRALSSPRRLIFRAEVALTQKAEVETVRGPAVGVAYRDGQPTKALEGFLRRVNKTPAELQRENIGGKEYLLAGVEKTVLPAHEVLPRAVTQVLETLPQPRSMRWGSGDARFIRPVRWLLLLFGDQVLSTEALGVRSGSLSYGNRTDHPEAVEVLRAGDYESTMASLLVEINPGRRRAVIQEVGDALAQEVGGVVDWDADLLNEVTQLVEWPTPFLGTFEKDFLQIPEPVLITSMKVHQRYFPMRHRDGALINAFVAVRNGKGEALDQVRRGNEKVLRARLSDARYFYQLDEKVPLADLEPKLRGVILHAKLGSYADKIARVESLFDRTRAWWPLDQVGAQNLRRAIHLYKCDLVTQVVSEFPELQGEMGAIHAQQNGEALDVQEAIRDQYRPGFPKDRVPIRPVAAILGLLDRADTLVSFYGAGIRPTGSEDPFGLRRVALGLARIAAETSVMGSHSVQALLEVAADSASLGSSVAGEVGQLVTQRLMSEWEADWPHEWLEAVLARPFPWTKLSDRLRFLADHHQSALFSSAAQAAKRLERIARGADETEIGTHYTGVEAALKVKADAALKIPEDDLAGWWAAVENLVPVVEHFFDAVLVMDPDPAVRRLRLGLVGHAARALGRYFDWDDL